MLTSLPVYPSCQPIIGKLILVSRGSIPDLLADVKTHLRITNTNEDAYITTLIDVSSNYIEQKYGSATRSTNWIYSCNMLPDKYYLPYPSCTLTSLKYYPYPAGTAIATATLNTDYRVDDDGCVQWFNTVKPSVDNRPDAVQYAFTQTVQLQSVTYHCIKMITASLFENREDGIINLNSNSYSWLDRVCSLLERQTYV